MSELNRPPKNFTTKKISKKRIIITILLSFVYWYFSPPYRFYGTIAAAVAIEECLSILSMLKRKEKHLLAPRIILVILALIIAVHTLFLRYKGSIYYDNGNILYEGEFKLLSADGYGYYYNEDGSISCEGELNHGHFNGYGITYHPNGEIYYEGPLENDKCHGKGKQYYDTGILEYEGEYLDNFWNGYGKRYYLNGNLQYDGYFQQDFYTGSGKYYDLFSGKLSYDGQWTNGLQNGLGKLYYENNKLKFEGQFIDSNPIEGTYYKEDGTTFPKLQLP
jgi:antitoxin component YwqK of YwqJK toxin-antitoxin module